MERLSLINLEVHDYHYNRSSAGPSTQTPDSGGTGAKVINNRRIKKSSEPAKLTMAGLKKTQMNERLSLATGHRFRNFRDTMDRQG